MLRINSKGSQFLLAALLLTANLFSGTGKLEVTAGLGGSASNKQDVQEQELTVNDEATSSRTEKLKAILADHYGKMSAATLVTVFIATGLIRRFGYKKAWGNSFAGYIPLVNKMGWTK